MKIEDANHGRDQNRRRLQGKGGKARFSLDETFKSPKALMALTPLQPLRETEAKALFAEAVETARGKMDALKAKLEL